MEVGVEVAVVVPVAAREDGGGGVAVLAPLLLPLAGGAGVVRERTHELVLGPRAAQVGEQLGVVLHVRAWVAPVRAGREELARAAVASA
jgi:hypothetical protein